MSLFPVLSLLICLSVHACNARYLGLVFDKETKASISAKDLGEKVPDKTSLPSEIVPPKLVENGDQGGRKPNKDVLSNLGNVLGVSTMEMKVEKDCLNDHEQSRILETSGLFVALSFATVVAHVSNKVRAGTEVIVSRSYPYETQQAGNQESSTVHAGGDVHEAAESKENETTEDIIEMDYAQPHRKPPIHNEKN
ncbi:hypothetical protein K2173_005392 [Erythroxylum novogranatense]|uniref:Uncharacterized protein n=1 Tax=Erythroxylum novogranatense TaxID=1862640 RepID=A0AAV8TBG7_9ROSI|nr:hypothetical protein K2173_005392 [Erythroxylum novogranatense]